MCGKAVVFSYAVQNVMLSDIATCLWTHALYAIEKYV